MENSTASNLIIALIASLPATLAALAAVIAAIRTGRNVMDIHKQINSRMDQLLLSAKSVAHFEGKREERAERDERDERDAEREK